jgi:hypothetical protein
VILRDELGGGWDVLGWFGEGRCGDGFVVAGDQHHQGSEEDAAEGCNLGVRHGVVEVEAWVDADELYEEAADAAEDEVLAGEDAERDGFGGALPEPPGEREGEEELVDWGGLDHGCGWGGEDERLVVGADAVGHVDAPGERGVDAVVAVAGGEAADAANAVADGCGGGGEVEHTQGGVASAQAVGPGDVALEHEHGNAGEQAAVPGESGLEPAQQVEQDVAGMVAAGHENDSPCAFEVANVLEFVPAFGADDACNHDHRDDVEGVGVYAVADEVPVQDNRAADGCEPEHQAKCANMSKTEIQIGIHAGTSIAGGSAAGGEEDWNRVFLKQESTFSLPVFSRSLSAWPLPFQHLSLQN